MAADARFASYAASSLDAGRALGSAGVGPVPEEKLLSAEKKPENTLIETPYLSVVLEEQDAYRAAPVAMLPRLTRALSAPMGFITQRIIPSEAIEAALRGADSAASASIRTAAISHDFSDLEACDEAVAEVRRWALGYAVTGGGAAGAFGALRLAIDMPATITLALRTARLTGLCYGFGADTPAERIHILDILQLAGANSEAEKIAAIERLATERREIPREDWKNIVQLSGQASGTFAATQKAAHVLGVNLSTRKLGQLAPVVGAAVGASVNAAFQNDIARAARFAYRARWLELNEGLIDGTHQNAVG